MSQNLTCEYDFPPALSINRSNQTACGVRGAASRLQTCCGTNNTISVAGGCWQWCDLDNGNLQDFTTCVSGVDGALRTDAFCFQGQNGTLEPSLAGLSANGASRTKYSQVSLALVVCVLLSVCMPLATASPSSTFSAVIRRQDSACGTSPFMRRSVFPDYNQTCNTFTPSGLAYNKIGASISATTTRSCQSDSPCLITAHIPPISDYCLNYNITGARACGVRFTRTLQAADSNDGAIDASATDFDPLFGTVAAQLNSQPGACTTLPKWEFIAEAYYESEYQYWMTAGTSSYVAVLPVWLCQKGVVSGCEGNLLASISNGIVVNGTEIEACQVVVINSAGRRNGTYSEGAVTPQVLLQQVLTT